MIGIGKMWCDRCNGYTSMLHNMEKDDEYDFGDGFMTRRGFYVCERCGTGYVWETYYEENGDSFKVDRDYRG